MLEKPRVRVGMITHSVRSSVFRLQFGRLMEVLHGMMEQIERQRLSKMMEEMPDNVTIQQRYEYFVCFYSARI